LTKISDHIGRSYCDLVRFFDNLVAAYFYWATLHIRITPITFCPHTADADCPSMR